MKKAVLIRCMFGTALITASATASAANPDFQSFFFGVCQNGGAQGNLSSRCAETPGGTGDLSGDSESSLNPSQTLSNNDTANALSLRQAKENRERLENLQQAGPAGSDSTMVSGRFSLLINGRTIDFERDQGADDDRQRNFDGDGHGADIGFDYRLSDSVVAGAMVSVFDTDATFARENDGNNFFAADNAGGMESDGWTLTVFGTATIGDTGYVDISGGYGQTDYTLKRNSVFQESGRSGQTNVVARADTEGTQLWGSISGGCQFNAGALTFGPYTGLIWARSETDGYTERDVLDTGLNLRVDDSDVDSLVGQVGVSAHYALSTSWGVVLPQLRLEYDHEFEDDAPTALAGFALDATGAEYRLDGVERDQDFIDLGASVALVMANGWSAALDYSTLLQYDDLERDIITLGFRKEL